ncbi:MAG: DUF4858 domain-containing protein [Tannerellaceae bacterium]|nr:DUF4858 domain-containing protein [Tannerellaceae bacterium]
MLEGKEKIQLKPEVLNAIEQGTLLNTETMELKDQLMLAPSEVPVSKDFTEFIKPDDAEKMVDPLTIPPAVFMRYGLNIPLPTVYKAFIVPGEIRTNAARPSGRSFNDGLMQLFSPKERAKARNRQNANAWRRYNRFP